MKILVTGGTGYIGSHTAVELLNAGHEVVLLDNLSNSFAWVADRIGQITGREVPFFKIDLTDIGGLGDFFQDHHDFHGVIHFAALKAVGESMEEPLKYYHHNLLSLVNLLGMMGRYSLLNLVYSSSCTVYGAADSLPVKESAPLKEALSPYGNTKKISEEIIRDQVRSGHLRSVSLRYFNPVGAHTSGLIGELPMGVPNNLMPYITQTALGKLEFLRVFGNDYPTPDGTPVRDYIHVSDLARAHMAALDRMLLNRQKSAWEVFNLGTGKGFSVLEVIRAFEEVNGVKVPYRIVERRPGDIAAIWADASLASKELGWKAELGIEDMVSTAWKWEKRNGKL